MTQMYPQHQVKTVNYWKQIGNDNQPLHYVLYCTAAIKNLGYPANSWTKAAITSIFSADMVMAVLV